MKNRLHVTLFSVIVLVFILNVIPFASAETCYCDNDGDLYSNSAERAYSIVDCSVYTGPECSAWISSSEDITTGDCNDDEDRIFRSGYQYYDADGDGYYNWSLGTIDCDEFEDYNLDLDKLILTSASNGIDCNDLNSAKNTYSGTYYYYDGDGDKYYDDSLNILGSSDYKYFCDDEVPPNWISNYDELGADCNDLDNQVWGDRTHYYDNDGDFYYASTPGSISCSEYASYPDRSKYINNSQRIDTDCDDTESRILGSNYQYLDEDGDFYYNWSLGTIECSELSLVPDLDKLILTSEGNGLDCNDLNSAKNTYSEAYYYYDSDNDKYYDDSLNILSSSDYKYFCDDEVPPNWISNYDDLGVDCNDLDNQVWGSNTHYYDKDGDFYYFHSSYGGGPSAISCSEYALYPDRSKYINSSQQKGYDCDDSDNFIKTANYYYYDNDGDSYYFYSSYGGGPNGLDCSDFASYPDRSKYVNSSEQQGYDCDDSNANVWGQETVRIDNDGDGYYNTSVGQYNNGYIYCSDYATLDTSKIILSSGSDADCNDLDSLVTVSQYYDGDGDLYYNTTFGTLSCPEYENNNLDSSKLIETDEDLGSDCDDTSNLVFSCGSQYYDYDSDGYYDSTLSNLYENELAGLDPTKIISYAEQKGTDCDDTSNLVFSCGSQYYDFDGDGYHNSTLSTLYADELAGLDYTKLINSSEQLGSDCDDNSVLIESCGYSNRIYYDFDQDGYYDSSLGYLTQEELTGLDYSKIINSTEYLGADCDDTNYYARYVYDDWYYDLDGDLFYNNSIVFDTCAGDTLPADKSQLITTSEALGADCDDSDNTKLSTSLSYSWVEDADSDGYYNDSTALNTCNGDTLPADLTNWDIRSNYDDSDCDDGNALVKNSGGFYYDGDGDGYYNSSLDRLYCNDYEENPALDLTKLISTLDSSGRDCNDFDISKNTDIDDFYYDADGDTYYNSSIGRQYFCAGEQPANWISTWSDYDCDDNNIYASSYNNNWYYDGDGDDYYFYNSEIDTCAGEALPADLTGWADNDSYSGIDCNDADPLKTDDYGWGHYYVDQDGDLYYNSSEQYYICVDEISSGWVHSDVDKGLDCNDNNIFAKGFGVHWAADLDGDNWYNDSTRVDVCGGETLPSDLTNWNTTDIFEDADCDDTNSSAYRLYTQYLDYDGDYYYFEREFCGTNSLVNSTSSIYVSEDLDDTNSSILGIGAPEWCDNIDNNGNGEVDETGCYCTPVDYPNVDIKMVVDTSGSFSNELRSLDIGTMYAQVVGGLTASGYSVTSEVYAIFYDYYGLTVKDADIALSCDSTINAYYSTYTIGTGDADENEAWGMAGYCANKYDTWRSSSNTLKTLFVLADEGPCGSSLCPDPQEHEVVDLLVDSALDKDIIINVFNDGSDTVYFRRAADETDGGYYSYSGGTNSFLITMQEALYNLTLPNCVEIPAVCGDGVWHADEQCEDGNVFNGDGCSATCELESICFVGTCGDGFIQPGEQCDPAISGSAVNCDASTCKLI